MEENGLVAFKIEISKLSKASLKIVALAIANGTQESFENPNELATRLWELSKRLPAAETATELPTEVKSEAVEGDAGNANVSQGGPQTPTKVRSPTKTPPSPFEGSKHGAGTYSFVIQGGQMKGDSIAADILTAYQRLYAAHSNDFESKSLRREIHKTILRLVGYDDVERFMVGKCSFQKQTIFAKAWLVVLVISIKSLATLP